jgi:hypothetical protein
MSRNVQHTRRRACRTALALVMMFAASCSDDPAGPAALTVASTTPSADAEGVGIEATVQVEFSADINAATVTSSSVKVETDGASVIGTLSVNGTTVTFTPTELLTERTTSYTLTVTTGVRGASGGRLDADVTRTFTTVFWDPAFYYRLTNMFQGATKSLDTFSNTFGCYMGNSGSFTGQRWYFTPIDGTDGYFSMRNQFQGEGKALEGADAPTRCLLGDQPTPTTFFSGQLWRAVAYGDGYRLQNANHGSAKSLDVIDDGAGTYVPMMIATGPFSGQRWFFARDIKR